MKGSVTAFRETGLRAARTGLEISTTRRSQIKPPSSQEGEQVFPGVSDFFADLGSNDLSSSAAVTEAMPWKAEQRRRFGLSDPESFPHSRHIGPLLGQDLGDNLFDEGCQVKSP